MDFGDLIYVIVGLIWLVVSFVGNKKKKQQKREAQETSKEQRHDGEKGFSTILDDILKESKERQTDKEKRYEKEGTRYATQEKKVEARPAKKYETLEDSAYDEEAGYEFGKYETMEDDYLEEESPYADYSSKEYNYDQKDKDRKAEIAKSKNKTAVAKEPKREEYDLLDDMDFDLEKAVVFSEILRRPRF